MRWIVICIFCLLVVTSVVAQGDADLPNRVSSEACTSNIVVSALPEDGVYDVFRMDDQERVNLTDDAANDYLAALSPDFEQIAFISDRGGGATELYLMDTEGDSVRQLTIDGYNKGLFDWSIDSRRIAYVVFYTSDPAWLTTMDTLEDFFGQRADIFVIDVETGDTQQVTQNTASILRLAWTLDRTQIAFIGEHDGVRGIYTVPVEGGDIRLVKALGNDLLPTMLQWSPDSHAIAYSVTTEDGDYAHYAVEIETGVIHDLSSANPADFSLISTWTADSTGIIRLTYTNEFQYELVNIATGNVTRIWEVMLRGYCLANVQAANALLEGEGAAP